MRGGRAVPADLYIAHYVAGLAAAAERRDQMAGACYDAEDFHAGRRPWLGARRGDAIGGRFHALALQPLLLIAEAYRPLYGTPATPY